MNKLLQLPLLPSLRRLCLLSIIAISALAATSCLPKEATAVDPEAGLPWRGVKFTLRGENYDFRKTKLYSPVTTNNDKLIVETLSRTYADTVIMTMKIGRTAYPDTIDLDREQLTSDITVIITDTAKVDPNNPYRKVLARYWSLPPTQNGTGKIIITKISGDRLQATFSGTLQRQQGSPAKYPAQIQITDGIIDTWQQVKYQ